MGWQGIEWVLPVYGIVIIVLPVMGFLFFLSRVKHAILKRIRALLFYSLMVLSPVILYAAFFFLLVGMEEWFRTAMITEGMGRTFLPAIGLGLTIWVVSTVIFWAALLWTSK